MAHSVEIPDYDQIMELDAFVQKTADEQPPALQFTPQSNILDAPSVIFHRYKGELAFHKTRCVLHRPFLSNKFIGTRMEGSRKLCVEAALNMIRHHEFVFEAAREGGQLSPARMYMASLSAHDFLLAAMVLCVELDLISSAVVEAGGMGGAACGSERGGIDGRGPNWERVGEMRGYIETSCRIYKEPVNHFAQTGKALKAMEYILRKSKDIDVGCGASGGMFIPDSFPLVVRVLLSNCFLKIVEEEIQTAGEEIPNLLDLQQPLPTTNASFIFPADGALDEIRLGDSEAIYNPGQDMDWVNQPPLHLPTYVKSPSNPPL